ncbi:hypothetical protein [Archaeoglobus neptunius]|uniref:hypothetical protein n=1 Tax=Archaeoglobus neptunius TaxID=2798580 RepID=UPI00192580CF|nr:hypothetical protein [Archaeoglobus neptunius]
MPFELERSAARLRCDVCGKIAKDPIVVKTCCVDKPVTFCGRKCYQKWKAGWMRRQEQIVDKRKRIL